MEFLGSSVYIVARWYWTQCIRIRSWVKVTFQDTLLRHMLLYQCLKLLASVEVRQQFASPSIYVSLKDHKIGQVVSLLGTISCNHRLEDAILPSLACSWVKVTFQDTLLRHMLLYQCLKLLASVEVRQQFASPSIYVSLKDHKIGQVVSLLGTISCNHRLGDAILPSLGIQALINLFSV